MNPLSLRENPLHLSSKRVDNSYWDEFNNDTPVKEKKQRTSQQEISSTEEDNSSLFYSTFFSDIPCSSSNDFEITSAVISNLRNTLDNQQQQINCLQNIVDDCVQTLRNIYKDELADEEDEWIYRGSTLEELPHGKGTFIHSNGDVYEGNWENGRKHGRGVVRFINGNVLEANWINDHQKGLGKIKYPNFDKYKGNLKHCLPSGYGIMTDMLGNERYEGMWRAGKRHGKGVLTDKIGNRYEGIWKKNKWAGPGKRTFSNGNSYTGEFKDEEGTPWYKKPPHGHGTGIINGIVYEGIWNNGKIFVDADNIPIMTMTTIQKLHYLKCVYQKYKHQKGLFAINDDSFRVDNYQALTEQMLLITDPSHNESVPDTKPLFDEVKVILDFPPPENEAVEID